MSIEIGIDVGWSKKSRSCGVAVRGIDPLWGEQQSVVYANGSIHVKLFQLSALVDWLSGFIERLGANLARTTLIVDGPLGLAGPPLANRYIDAACRTRGFHRRAFPNDVEGNGQVYVDATYQIVNPFLTSGHTSPWLGESAREGLIVAETHPTVGLAMVLPMLDEVPSRKRPFVVDGRLVRAKSDWYWLRGAGQVVASVLEVNDVAAEKHHERRAALFCVAVAKRLAEGLAFALGRAEPHQNGREAGVYVLPCEINSNWWEDVRRIGVMAIGQPRNGARLIDGGHDVVVPGGGAADDGDGIPPEATDQNQEITPYSVRDLVLCDNGGVWEKHNPWLAAYDENFDVSALDRPGDQIQLSAAGGSGQWTSEPKNLPLARARGFQGQHLSLTECVIIPVRVP